MRGLSPGTIAGIRSGKVWSSTSFRTLPFSLTVLSQKEKKEQLYHSIFLHLWFRQIQMHSAEGECTLTGDAVHSAKPTCQRPVELTKKKWNEISKRIDVSIDFITRNFLDNLIKSRKLKSDANNKYREHNMTRKLSE